MEYVGADNERHRPVMIHRALMGSIERFFGILVEHYAGAFPLWLAPVQARVLPVSDEHGEYAASVVQRLQAAGLRVDSVAADESLGARIRRAKLEKLPYVLVVGADDLAAGTVGVNALGRATPGARRSCRAADLPPARRSGVQGPGGRSFVSLERLWAGWRSAYVATADDHTPQVCVLCRITGPGDDAEHLVLWRGEQCAAVLNAFPYCSGHLMVVPLRHVADLEDLEATEAGELWSAVTAAIRAIKTAYDPDGLNVGCNLGRAAGAGIPDHLHVQVLPRWAGDTNFMTSVASLRVMPEALPDSWARLRAAWPPG